MSYTGQYQTAISSTYLVYVSSNYGQTWSGSTTANGLTANNINFVKVSVSSSGQYQVISYQSGGAPAGGVFISSNYGQTWTNVSSGSTVQMMGVAISGNGQYIILGSNYNATSYIYISSNYGLTWTATSQQIVNGSEVVISNTGQYMLATNLSNNVFLSSNYGANWSQLPNYGAMLAISSSGQYIAVGSTSTGTYISSNYGASFTLNSSLINIGGISISSTGQYMIAHVFSSGLIWVSSNYGLSWTSISTGYTNMYGCAVSGNGLYLGVCQTSSGYVYTSALSTSALGSVGIGTTAPYTILQIYGTGSRRTGVPQGCPLILTNSYNGSSLVYVWETGPNVNGDYCIMYNNAGVYLNKSNPGSGWVNQSDIRLKDEIKPLIHNLTIINSLNPVSYRWKSNLNSTYKTFGLIAQEVLEVIPEIISTSYDAIYGEVYGIQYTSIIPILIGAINEQSAEIAALKEQMAQVLAKLA
jgi:hypothetical protein